jgi:hypothetical protein
MTTGLWWACGAAEEARPPRERLGLEEAGWTALTEGRRVPPQVLTNQSSDRYWLLRMSRDSLPLDCGQAKGGKA